MNSGRAGMLALAGGAEYAPSIGIIRTGTKGLSQHAGLAGEYPCVNPQYRPY